MKKLFPMYKKYMFHPILYKSVTRVTLLYKMGWNIYFLYMGNNFFILAYSSACRQIQFYYSMVL